jgi:hypothetical protein
MQRSTAQDLVALSRRVGGIMWTSELLLALRVALPGLSTFEVSARGWYDHGGHRRIVPPRKPNKTDVKIPLKEGLRRLKRTRSGAAKSLARSFDNGEITELKNATLLDLHQLREKGRLMRLPHNQTQTGMVRRRHNLADLVEVLRGRGLVILLVDPRFLPYLATGRKRRPRPAAGHFITLCGYMASPEIFQVYDSEWKERKYLTHMQLNKLCRLSALESTLVTIVLPRPSPPNGSPSRKRKAPSAPLTSKRSQVPRPTHEQQTAGSNPTPNTQPTHFLRSVRQRLR